MRIERKVWCPTSRAQLSKRNWKVNSKGRGSIVVHNWWRPKSAQSGKPLELQLFFCFSPSWIQPYCSRHSRSTWSHRNVDAAKPSCTETWRKAPPYSSAFPMLSNLSIQANCPRRNPRTCSTMTVFSCGCR